MAFGLAAKVSLGIASQLSDRICAESLGLGALQGFWGEEGSGVLQV